MSNGTPLESIEEMADWVIALLDSLDVKTACLVGHSQGCLVAIDAAARYSDRVSRLGLIAGALTIPVNDQLLTMSDKALGKAISVMTSWGHGPMAHMHDNTQPGHSFLGYGNRLMASNHADALRHDLTACNNYSGGKAAAATITQPALCILAASDRMTPVNFGNAMAYTLVHRERVIMDGAGHM